MSDPADPADPPRGVLIAALVLAVAAVGAVLAIAVVRQRSSHAVVIPAVPAPQALDPACTALLAALPQRLGDYRRTDIAAPVPDGAAAWAADSGPVVARCGLDRPSEFVVGSAVQVVDGVQWFQVGTGDRSTWYTVDRPVYVALTLPPGSGPAPIQQLSELIDTTMPAVPVRPGPPQ